MGRVSKKVNEFNIIAVVLIAYGTALGIAYVVIHYF